MENPTPDGTSDADLKNRVVAWHNRSLLTCRIRADQVTGIGIVALPFSDSRSAVPGTAPHGRFASLRARIDAVVARLTRRLRRRRKSAALPLFNEDFIPPLKPKAVARFARRHGDAQQPGSTAWPKRKIKPFRASGRHTRRYLRTAAIEYGGRRMRVLIGSGAEPHIIGPRLWSRRRLAGLLAGFGLVVVGSIVASLWPGSEPAGASPPIALAPTEHPPPPGAAETRASAAVASTVVEPPPAASAAARDEEPDQPAALAPASPSAPAAAISAASVPTEVADDEPRFALAAEPTRSRVSSMLRLSLLNFPTEPQKNGVHAELMQSGAAWRVVIWPYPSREAAEKGQTSLRQRGVKVELIAF